MKNSLKKCLATFQNKGGANSATLDSILEQFQNGENGDEVFRNQPDTADEENVIDRQTRHVNPNVGFTKGTRSKELKLAQAVVAVKEGLKPTPLGVNDQNEPEGDYGGKTLIP